MSNLTWGLATTGTLAIQLFDATSTFTPHNMLGNCASSFTYSIKRPPMDLTKRNNQWKQNQRLHERNK